MNDLDCKTCEVLIHGYLDHELDAATTTRVAGHLAGCEQCARRHEQARQLIDDVRKRAPYYRAPEALNLSLLGAAPTRPSAAAGFMQGLRALSGRWWAPAFSTLVLSLAVMLYVVTPSAEQPWLDEAVSSHVRSLMAEHLNDVVSSDRHTVKPWFTGKLDFAPPVFDYAAQGYPLLGGRLDYLQHQTAAALAYRHARHTINLFVLPTTESDRALESLSLRGYNVVAWRRDHLRFILVSDLEKGELEAFGKLIEKGS
ncbi:anti-sigma factor [Pseudomonas gingeri]|uniref:anti-sigma factor family protein n=1 Tax=Pseudomonas gingeri TaxID=117681 RepID=UPI0015A4DD52|nr:anti-sigma factor [Pseudomonas gingeri]NVZ61583.1 anti-sigma factor [Pseudomonas gingeri]NVZ75610.1 anti-sigma factor [Pseudomonas gingeri]